MMTSLDHAMWFHAPFKADKWMLCVEHCLLAFYGTNAFEFFEFHCDCLPYFASCGAFLFAAGDICRTVAKTTSSTTFTTDTTASINNNINNIT
jgi:hypothetical protein